jgi:hypothetical protein
MKMLLAALGLLAVAAGLVLAFLTWTRVPPAAGAQPGAPGASIDERAAPAVLQAPERSPAEETEEAEEPERVAQEPPRAGGLEDGFVAPPIPPPRKSAERP